MQIELSPTMHQVPDATFCILHIVPTGRLLMPLPNIDQPAEITHHEKEEEEEEEEGCHCFFPILFLP